MKKAFTLGMVMVLAFGLVYAWADQPNITENHQMTDVSVDETVTRTSTVASRALDKGEVPVLITEKGDLKKDVKIAGNVKRSQIQRPMTASIVFSDDFEDGDYTVNPTWIETNDPAGHPWAIQTDPWNPNSYDNIDNNGAGWLVGLDDDAGGSASATACTLSTTYEGTGLPDLNLFYYLYFKGYGGEWFEVLIDGIQVDLVTANHDGDRQVDISAYNAVGTHTLAMIYDDNSSWGYAQGFDDVLIIDDPPALGACCYGTLEEPFCIDELEVDCIARVDFLEWNFGLECATYECPARPDNDLCANAIAVGEGTYYENTSLATSDGIGTHSINQDVWYCYTPSGDGEATVALCNSDYDTKLAIWEGCTCPPTVELAYEDDGCYGRAPQSDLTITVTGGQTYLIQAGSYSAYVGNLVVDITLVQDPPGRCCYGDPTAPDCDDITESECAALSGTWDVTMNCTDDPCPVECAEDELMLILDTDSWGSETTWDVINHDDITDTLASGGPYGAFGHYEEQICIAADACVDVYIYDAYGDGGPDYEIWFNDVLLTSGTLAGYGSVFGPIGNGCALGACCDDVTGICTDDVSPMDCLGMAGRWGEATLCVDLEPPCVPLGSCCYDDGLPQCAINAEPECTALEGTWTYLGTCDDCLPCVGAVYDNGGALDDYGSPGSQVISSHAGAYQAGAADDFTLAGIGAYNLDMISAVTTHWNGANGPGRGPNLYTAVELAIYSDYHFGTPDTSWPGGYLAADQTTYVDLDPPNGIVHTETITNFSFWPLTRDCTGDAWQINLAVDLELQAGVTYWVSIMPVMPLSAEGGQCAFALSDMNTGEPAHSYFFGLAVDPWTEIGGNGGNCDTLIEEGTMQDLAFCLSGYNIGSMYGAVSDADGGAPIEGVNVEILGTGLSTLTEANGSYVFADVVPGTYNVAFTHDEYDDTTEVDVVIAGGVATELFMQMNLSAYAYLVGDANMRLESLPMLLGADVTYMVNYFNVETGTPGCKIDHGAGEFYMAADVNGDCLIIGSDVTRLVNHLRGMDESDLVHCPDYTPLWFNNQEVPTDPGDLPAGWPPCVPLPPAATSVLPSVSE